MPFKLSPKQRLEIEFLSEVWPDERFVPTDDEIENFIDAVVHGKKSDKENRLLIQKRILEITLGMWRDSLKRRLLFIGELRQEFSHPYIQKIIKQLEQNI
jgi:hypothetical protein